MAVYKKIIGKDEKGNPIRSKNWSIDYYLEGRKIVETVGRSKREAEGVLNERKTEIRQKKFKIKPRVKDCLFKEFSQEYFNSFSQNKRCVERERVIIRHMNDFMGKKRLSSITLTTIETYKAERAKKVSHSTVNRELDVAKHLFGVAVDEGKIESNPVKKINKFLVDDKREKILSIVEIKKLIDASPPHLKPILIMSLSTGVRKQETLSLRWDSINFERNVITLEATNTKSKKSREIPISDLLRNILIEMSSKAKSVYVFPDPRTNKPYKDIKKSFKTACKKADISGYRWHDNRHVFATYAIQNGTDIATLSQILGHQDIEITMRYISPTNETKLRAVNIMGDILSQLEDTDIEMLENMEKSRTDLETFEKTGKKKKHKKVISLSGYWSGRADSNGRPRRPERRALNQAELRPVCCPSLRNLLSARYAKYPSCNLKVNNDSGYVDNSCDKRS